MKLTKIGATAIGIVFLPVLAAANPKQFNLVLGLDGTKAIAKGHTGGSYSLLSIANADNYNRPCIGYGDPKPDHIMILEKNFSSLKIQVDSSGKDTTLVIRGPNNKKIRCSFGNGNNREPEIQERNWEAGTYEIWVGSLEPGKTWNYRLSVEP